ncbi:MAG TPA: hypothetical protein VN924_32045 [Bryobacteraceae bacterium]|nr:hypothetical protein [Bryobacteraceae bacterium]
MASLAPLNGFVVLWCLASAAGAQALPDILSRVSEEAEVFRRVAPQVLAEETLTQRALKAPPRFHPRLGSAAAQPAIAERQTREIVSEYSFGAFKDAPESLHEFRQLISVDGQAVSAAAAARHSLALGLTSSDDHARKRMLEDFQKYGLTDAAVDFGPLLLLFTRRQAGHYHFELTGDGRIGADQVKIVSYTQISGPGRMLVFQGRRATHQPIQGRIYARVPDGVPLRITIVASRVESRPNGKSTFRDEAVVDYTPNAQGFLAPAAVTHRAFAGDQLLVEDDFRYSTFRKFGADAEIKFDVQQ